MNILNFLKNSNPNCPVCKTNSFVKRIKNTYNEWECTKCKHEFVVLLKDMKVINSSYSTPGAAEIMVDINTPGPAEKQLSENMVTINTNMSSLIKILEDKNKSKEFHKFLIERNKTQGQGDRNIDNSFKL